MFVVRIHRHGRCAFTFHQPLPKKFKHHEIITGHHKKEIREDHVPDNQFHQHPDCDISNLADVFRQKFNVQIIKN
jgi:hypothetical protein